MRTYHTMQDGTEIRISDMSDSHLANTVKLIRKRAENGIVVRYGGGGPDPGDMWYDEDFLEGEEALEYLEVAAYEQELARRSKA